MVSFALVAVVAVLLVVMVTMMSGGGRGLFAALGVLGLVLVGGAAFFLLGTKAPVAPAPVLPPTVAVAPPAAVVESPQAPAAPAGWTARGRVFRGETGEEKFAGAVLEVFDAKASPAPMGEARVTGMTGEDGSFVLAGIGFPSAQVRASAKGCVPVVVAADGKLDLTLRLLPGSFAAGRVIDRETKAPVTGARVTSGDGAGALTGKDGTFRLEGVPLGRSSLEARAAGYVRGKKSITPPEKEPEKGVEGVEISLVPGAGVAGTVLDAEGKPVPGAKVEVQMLFDAPVVGETPVPIEHEEILSGPDGKYRADGLPAGRKLRLRAATATLLSGDVPAGPVAKGTVQEGVDIAMAPGAFVAATVVDGKGAPVAGASISVVPADEKDAGGMMGPMMSRLRAASGDANTTDAKGMLRAGPVKAGPVTVHATKQDFRPAELPAVVSGGADCPVSLVLEAGAAIRGRVQDGTGAPVAEASVTATHFGGGIPVMETRTSAADGTFTVGGLDGKGYTLRTEKKGFVASSLNAIVPGGDEVVVTLATGGIIVGKVADEAGAPMRAFSVTAKRTDVKSGANPMDWQRMVADAAGTQVQDAGGNFRVEGIEPGTYRVEARAEGLAPGRAEGILVVSGREAAVSIVLAEGLALHGVVVRKTDGTPVEGASVRIPAEGMFGEFDMGMDTAGIQDVVDASGQDVQDATPMSAGMGAFSRGSVTTGADGTFTLRGLEPGTLRLKVSAKGFGPATARGIEVPSAAPVRVELPEEASIEGTVTDAQGAPKAGAMIMLQKLPAMMRFANTDEQGHYRIAGVGGGSYLFYVMEGAGMMQGSLNLKSESVTLEDGKTTHKDYRFGEGTKVIGTVTRGGKPVDGVMVILMPASKSSNPMAAMMGGGGGGGGFAMGSTKADGSFEISGVSPGRYTASAQEMGFGGAAPSGEAFEVRRGDTEVKHDVLLPEAGIHGIVVDDGGEPVTGAVVTAAVPGKDLGHMTDIGSALESMGGQAFSDDEGKFQLSSMKPGTYRLQVQAAGFGTEVVDGVAAGVGGAEVRVVLKKGMEVTVRVTGPGNTAVRGAAIFLADAEGRELTNMAQFDAVRTGDDGSAVVRAPAGTLRFEAVAAGFATGETTAAVPGNEVVIRLVKGAVLNATVTDGSGAAVVGAGVELLDASGKAYSTRFSLENLADMMQGGVTGSGGLRTWKDLPAGTWIVRARVAEGRTADGTISVGEGETKDLTIRVP